MKGVPDSTGPQAMLIPPVEDEPRVRAAAGALGFHLGDTTLEEYDAGVMRTEGVEPRLSDAERELWRYFVSSMYAIMGGEPARR